MKTTQSAASPPATIETRFKYNQDFDSIYAMVPSTMSLLLALFPAILMALAIVREKELGSITNLYVTPVTRLEFLVGKQLPYIAVAMANFILMLLMALFVFQVPLKGSFPTLAPGGGDLCDGDHRLRHADFSLHAHPDCRVVRDGNPDRSARHPVLRHDDAGFVAVRRGSNHGAWISDDLFRADQRRHLHQGTWALRILASICSR